MGEMSVGEMSVVEMSVGEMSVGEMSVGEVLDEIIYTKSDINLKGECRYKDEGCDVTL